MRPNYNKPLKDRVLEMLILRFFIERGWVWGMVVVAMGRKGRGSLPIAMT